MAASPRLNTGSAGDAVTGVRCANVGATNAGGCAMRYLGSIRFTLLLVVATAELSSSPSFGQSDKTGVEFLRECEGRHEEFGRVGIITCAVYLAGFVDSERIISPFVLLSGQRAFCLPEEGLENEQIRLVVTKWLRENPQELHTSARVSIFVALKRAFPCAEGGVVMR